MRGAALALAIMAVLAVAAVIFVGWRRNVEVARQRAELASDVERGGVANLGRAQALGRRLFVADPDDEEAAAALAFTSALLALDYGFNTAREAEAVLARIEEAKRPPGPSAGVAAAARALCSLRAGNRKVALSEAAAAVAAWPDLPHPLFALGRARALSGDLAGGARALEAAVLDSPAFSEAQVSWAEARLDLGDAPAARAALEATLSRVPTNPRARLLLDEAEQALDVRGSETLRRACPDAGVLPPVVQAGCTLARALRARRAGTRREALGRLAGVAATVPEESRTLARTAQALAQLGAVDEADRMLARARRLAAPELPALKWAAVAIALARGLAVSVPPGPRPSDPEARLLVARTALAVGGVGALAAALDALGGPALASDSDLRALAVLRGAASARMVGGAGDDPLRAYVAGLRAQIDGDLPHAAQNFRGALSGHGDACRAAGEYVATLRALKARLDPGAFNALRAENAGCVNLH